MSLDITTCIAIIENGKYYFPAWMHYGKETTVQCDKCQIGPISDCIGFQNYDICMNCAKIISSYKNSQMINNNQQMRTRMEISNFQPPQEFRTQMEVSRFQPPQRPPQAFQTNMATSRFQPNNNEHMTFMESSRFKPNNNEHMTYMESSRFKPNPQFYETEMEQEYFKLKSKESKESKKETEPFTFQK